MHKGFTEAFEQLKQLLADTRSLKIDPDSAISKAQEIRAQIASGFGIQFLSGKYKKQSQGEIRSKLTEADQIIQQIKDSATLGKEAQANQARIAPEFAGGFAYRNGLLTGGVAGKDSLPSLLMPGEIVVNQRQQSMMRRAAGFDVFAVPNIPHYPARMAGGGYVSGATVIETPAPQNISIVFEGAVALGDGVKAYLVSDDGKRTQIDVYKNLQKKGDIK